MINVKKVYVAFNEIVLFIWIWHAYLLSKPLEPIDWDQITGMRYNETTMNKEIINCGRMLTGLSSPALY